MKIFEIRFKLQKQIYDKDLVYAEVRRMIKHKDNFIGYTEDDYLNKTDLYHFAKWVYQKRKDIELDDIEKVHVYKNIKTEEYIHLAGNMVKIYKRLN